MAQILGVFDIRANDLGEAVEKVGTRWGELVATDEPAVVTEPLFDAIVVEDSQDNGSLADSPGAD